MSADIYADNARQIQEKIGMQAQSKINDIDDMKTNLTDAYNTTISNYTAKWSEVQQLGTAGVTTPLAVKGVRAAVNKYRSLKAARDARNAGKPPQKKEGEDGGEAEDGDGGTPSIQSPTGDDPVPNPAAAEPTPTPAGTDGAAPKQGLTATDNQEGGRQTDVDADIGEADGPEFSGARPPAPDLASGESNIFTDGYNALKQKIGDTGRSLAQGAKNIFTSKGGGGGADPVAPAITDASEEGADFTFGEMAAGAIPVIGEGLLAIGGLVALGEGIAHLFDKPDKPDGPSATIPNQAPAALTAKYADALPSADNSVDRGGGSTAF